MNQTKTLQTIEELADLLRGHADTKGAALALAEAIYTLAGGALTEATD